MLENKHVLHLLCFHSLSLQWLVQRNPGTLEWNHVFCFAVYCQLCKGVDVLQTGYQGWKMFDCCLFVVLWQKVGKCIWQGHEAINGAEGPTAERLSSPWPAPVVQLWAPVRLWPPTSSPAFPCPHVLPCTPLPLYAVPMHVHVLSCIVMSPLQCAYTVPVVPGSSPVRLYSCRRQCRWNSFYRSGKGLFNLVLET